MTFGGRIRAACLLLVGLAAMTAPAHAAPDERAQFAQRLDPAVASTVADLLREVRAKQLPTEPLIATALEGAARGIARERIIAAVRAQATALEGAREALGPRATEAEIVAGASAIRARVPADSLVRLRAARRGSLVIPLVVTADMIARGVPPAAASGTVLVAARAGMDDDDLVRLREHVARDIGAGVAPGDAARIRTQAMLVNRASRRTAPESPRPLVPERTP